MKLKSAVIFTVLLNVVSCARILFYSYCPSVSHQNVFKPIWKELSLRGHEVVAIATHPLNDPSLTNLTEIDVSIGYDLFKKFDYSNLRRDTMSAFAIEETILNSHLYGMELEMNTKGMQELLKKPSDYFDLILIEPWNFAAFGIQHKFKAPVIAVCSAMSEYKFQGYFGNPTHPFLYYDFTLERNNEFPGFTIWQKIDILYVTIGMWIKSKTTFLPNADAAARKYFGNDMPYIEDMVRNVSMLLMNVNPVITHRKPNAPNVVEFYNVHVAKAEPLPKIRQCIDNCNSVYTTTSVINETHLVKITFLLKHVDKNRALRRNYKFDFTLRDLQNILDKAKNGVVFFSLGTNIKLESLQGNMKKAILEALGELPFTVLCKWESEAYPGKPENVLLRKWYPQQSILAHPNVKVFVTQGGLQSSEEAISRGIPLVAIPLFADQMFNAKKLTESGMAETILPEKVTKDLLRDTILKVSTEKYRLRAQELRKIYLDQPQSGLDKIIWWCEYVIRHQGAKHLRSLGADICLYEYFMLDVLAVILIAFLATYKLFSVLLRTLVGLQKCDYKPKDEPKEKKN